MKTSEIGLMRRGAYLATVLGFALMSSVPAVLAEMVEYQGKQIDIATPGETIPGQIVVVAETPQAQQVLKGLAGKMGATVKRDVAEAGMQLWQLGRADAAKATLAKINGMPGFHAYESPKMSISPPPGAMRQLMKDRPGGPATQVWSEEKGMPTDQEPSNWGGVRSEDVGVMWTSNDVSVSNQWALWRVNEPLAAAPPTATKGIAIIDTGVDYTHPDLAGKVVSVWDYVDNDADAMDVYGHGTHCAGIAAAKANNTVGIRGASPNSKIYAYRVLNEYGSGSFVDIIAAIRKAADNASIGVLSLSLGGYVLEGSSAYNDMMAAVNYAVSTKGKILVAAAGNEENDYLYYYQWSGYNYRVVPGWVPNSFTVGASTETDSRAEFSNYDVTNRASPDGTTTYNWNFVDIVAPGTNILSTTMGDGYERWSGTSMATPLVAGAAARVWDTYTTLTGAQVRARLTTYGTSLGAANGFPSAEKRLDMYKALGGTLAGGFIGRVLHGELGQTLENVKVEAMKGSTVAATALTNRAGYYILPSLASYTSGYTLRLSKSGFVTRTTPSVGDRPAGSLKSVSDQPIAPSRATTTADENWRIIVSWTHGDPGYDFWVNGYWWSGFYDYFPYTWYHSAGLEANAYLKTPSGTTIYWGYKGSLTSTPYAQFMHDSYAATPIETHVIRDQASGTYKYWLRVDPDDYGWGAIKYGLGTTANPSYPSYPVVLVYKGNTLMKTIYASAATRSGTGTKYWNVLTLNGNTVTSINQITDTLP